MFDLTDRSKRPSAATVLPSRSLSIPHPSATNGVKSTACDPSPMIRVVVVDDHGLVRNGIAFSLLAYSDIEVVAQISSGEEAVRYCVEAERLPNVVLMDLQMPGMSGVDTIRALQTQVPSVQIVVLTSFQDGTLVEEALQAGAIGYLLKDVAVEELAKAIRLAHCGKPSLAPTAAQALVYMATRRPPELGHDLTEREREVLALMAEGVSNQEIADRLVISPATVKFHTRAIRGKLGASSRTETVVLALNNHLVPASTSHA